MLPPFLAAACLLLATFSGCWAKDFAGGTTVLCPTADYANQQCAVFVNNPLACFQCDPASVIGLITSLGENLDASSTDTITIPLPCECLVLRDCPETCVEENDPDNDELPATSTTVFQGPTLLRCPILDYFTMGCETDASMCDADRQEECATDLPFDFSSLFGDDFSFTIPLRCDCVTATCPETCQPEPLDELNSYRGPGTVQCPEDAYDDRPCLALPRLFRDCNRTDCDILSTVLGTFDVNRTNDGIVELQLPCDCWEASNCPEECSFTEGLPQGVSLLEFEGPALLRCPFVDYFAAQGCQVDTSTCAAESDCDTGLNIDLTGFEFASIVVPLNCDCVKASCPATCTKEDLEPSHSFRGPGIVTCPAPDFDDTPCFPFPRLFSSCSDANCRLLDVLRISPNRTDDGSVVISLPCDCWEATNCADTCVLDNETLPFAFDTVDFVGPGVVSCPLDSFLLSPCLPSLSGDTTCEQCLTVQSFVESAESVSVDIPLACDCIELKKCHQDCSFQAETNPVNPNDGNTFRGESGKVTCPIDALTVQPCFPIVTDIESCLDPSCFSGIFLSELRVSDGEFVDISIPCDCVELRNCPESCTFSVGGSLTEPSLPTPTSPNGSPTQTPVSSQSDAFMAGFGMSAFVVATLSMVLKLNG